MNVQKSFTLRSQYKYMNNALLLPHHPLMSSSCPSVHIIQFFILLIIITYHSFSMHSVMYTLVLPGQPSIFALKYYILPCHVTVAAVLGVSSFLFPPLPHSPHLPVGRALITHSRMHCSSHYFATHHTRQSSSTSVVTSMRGRRRDHCQ